MFSAGERGGPVEGDGLHVDAGVERAEDQVLKNTVTSWCANSRSSETAGMPPHCRSTSARSAYRSVPGLKMQLGRGGDEIVDVAVLGAVHVAGEDVEVDQAQLRGDALDGVRDDLLALLEARPLARSLHKVFTLS